MRDGDIRNTKGKVYKDRIAVIALLQSRISRQRICIVSTHLQRNPEDPSQDMLRARQVGRHRFVFMFFMCFERWVKSYEP